MLHSSKFLENWQELWLAARVIQLLHILCSMQVIANINCTLGTGFIDTAIVGNLHPLENRTYHAAHDIGPGADPWLLGRYYVVELELSPASLFNGPRIWPDILWLFKCARSPRFLLSTQSASQLPLLYRWPSQVRHPLPHRDGHECRTSLFAYNVVHDT
jgi:hypothetical protein